MVTFREAASAEISAVPAIASRFVDKALRACRAGQHQRRYENDKSGHLGFSKRLKAREATRPLPRGSRRVAMA
jgi:hypothetical protein